ncbi:MAG: hypothetical protein KJS95_11220 [Gammaproteobacteria bacterium]|nr:hypothetical protein [Gammaproteobacteria bacterium]
MSLTHHVAHWVEEQPEQCASLEQLHEQFDPKRLESALQQCRRNGWLEHRRGVWFRTDRRLAEQGRPEQVLRTDLDGYDLQVALRLADQRFAKAIGAARFEDVAVVAREPMFRRLPEPRMSVTGCSSAMCAEQQPQFHDYQQPARPPRPGHLDREVVRRMVAQGMSQRAIAAKLGVWQSEVSRAVRDNRKATP